MTLNEREISSLCEYENHTYYIRSLQMASGDRSRSFNAEGGGMMELVADGGGSRGDIRRLVGSSAGMVGDSVKGMVSLISSRCEVAEGGRYIVSDGEARALSPSAKGVVSASMVAVVGASDDLDGKPTFL